jgi:23S rRNA (pseudouridine1915-N3)-methyltransferase
VKIVILFIGKTDKEYIKKGIEDYAHRLNFYLPVELKIIPDVKKTGNLSEELQKEKEGKLILEHAAQGDQLVLLDEKGKEFSSVEFSRWIEKKMIAGTRQLIFVVGGPYGFSKAVYEKAGFSISLSKMTFSHQMVRMIFVEQLYRSMTILRNEPYHHE